MRTPRKIQSETLPNLIVFLGDGTYYYNYNPSEITVSVHNQETNEDSEETRYEFIQVHLSGNPDYATIVEGVIRQFLSVSEEFDIINSYNKSILNNIKDSKDVETYISYLELLNTIKSTVKESLK